MGDSCFELESPITQSHGDIDCVFRDNYQNKQQLTVESKTRTNSF